MRVNIPEIRRLGLETLQINLGYKCNQACVHCHVNAGPKRTEQMSLRTIKQILSFIDKTSLKAVDLTGGAPELNPYFRTLVRELKERELEVIDRCNLTILTEQNFGDLGIFLAENAVKIIASMPCYSKKNLELQRGRGIFDRSLVGLKILNSLGYGLRDSNLILDLVYNPSGAELPPDSAKLERLYKKEMAKYDIFFNKLLTITNMPINRFRSQLKREGKLDDYLSLLRRGFNMNNVKHAMCRTILSIDWQGFIYDCDFNQMMAIPAGDKRSLHISEVSALDFDGAPVAVRQHCLGCFAGKGSSCSGSLT